MHCTTQWQTQDVSGAEAKKTSWHRHQLYEVGHHYAASCDEERAFHYVLSTT